MGVHGAAGGVGLTAVEIGKALGARVIATAGGQEKLEIAKRHLLPKAIREHALKAEEFSVTDEALLAVIRTYTREAGVRNFERELMKLLSLRSGAQEPVVAADKGLEGPVVPGLEKAGTVNGQADADALLAMFM